MTRRLHTRDDPYPVLLRAGLLDGIGAKIRKLWPQRRVAVITQAAIETQHGTRLRASLAGAGIEAFTLRMPAGEEKKTLDTVSRLYDRLLAHGFSRDDAIVAFGGGTVGDTAGFVAATYLRGIPYVQVPTTLLAQIDSAIGAKVGVNHESGKNLVGAIYRPSAVYIDPDVLATLPSRELSSGKFELLKYGFIGVPRILKRVEHSRLDVGSDALERSIGDGVKRKLAVVRVDEKENGLRRILNFGHTIGHGLEAASSYRLLRHGEAVGWGMIAAVRLAARREVMTPRLAARLEDIIRSVGPLPRLGRLSKKSVLAAVQKDKKRSRHGLRFILPVGLGEVEVIENFPADEIAWAVTDLGVGP